MTLEALIWLSIAILLGMIEGMTAGLVSLWFAGGAVAAFITALLGGKFILQIVVFAVVSAVLLASTRSLAKNRLSVDTTATNADRILGRLAVVSEPIDNLKATGAVRIDGVEWTARCKEDKIINAGETVKILQIDGVKVVVEPMVNPEEPAGPPAQPEKPETKPAEPAEPAASAS